MTKKEVIERLDKIEKWINDFDYRFTPEWVDSQFPPGKRMKDDVISDVYKIFGRFYPLADYLRDLYERQWGIKKE